MKNYIERLNAKIKEAKDYNFEGADICAFYNDCLNTKVSKYNYIWRVKLLPFMKAQYKKRKAKANFDRKLFSKIIFNNLYDIRQNKDDLISPYWDKESDIYNFYACHQYWRRELEKMSIDDIIFISWELSKKVRA